MTIYSIQLEENHTGFIIFSTDWHSTAQGAIDEAIKLNPRNAELYGDNIVTSTLIVD